MIDEYIVTFRAVKFKIVGGGRDITFEIMGEGVEKNQM